MWFAAPTQAADVLDVSAPSDRARTAPLNGGAPSRSARQLGRSLVGLRVSVWWEEDEAWYDGTIRDFDDVMGEHLVAYDDGDQGHEVLDTCRCARHLPSDSAYRNARSRLAHGART